MPNKTMNNTNSPSLTNPSKMFDLKMCLLDFMRISSNGTRQKKPLKAMANRYPAHYAHNTFSKGDMIQFNENMSMTSRCSTIKFSRCPTGNFKPNAVKSTRPPHYPVYEWIEPKRSGGGHPVGSAPLHRSLSGFSLNRCDRIAPNAAFEQAPRRRRPPAAVFTSDCSSDERGASTTTTTGKSHSESPLSDTSVRETETDDYLCSYSDCEQRMDAGRDMAALDSFCTLCTSSFSFTRCQHCENSSCGSKCDSSQGGRTSAKLLLSGGGGGGGGGKGSVAKSSGGGGESSETSGAISSDCESVLYR